MFRKKSLSLLNLCLAIPVLCVASNSQNAYALDITFAVFALITLADIFLIDIKNGKTAYTCAFINRTFCITFSLILCILFGTANVWLYEMLYVALQYWVLTKHTFWLDEEMSEEFARYNEIYEATLCELHTQMTSDKMELLEKLENLVQDKVAMYFFYCYFKSEEIQMLLNEDMDKIATLIKKKEFATILKMLECDKT